MKLIFASCFFLGALTVSVAASPSVKSLPVDRFQASGLHKLSEAELAELDASIELLMSKRIVAVQDEAKAAVAAAEAKASSSRKAGPSWLGALIALDRAEKNAGPSEDLRTRLEGTIKTFSGRRNFKLANGQVWQMVEAGSYAGPVYENPEVIIRPGMMGTFWLNIPDAALRVKVKPVKLE